MNINRKNILIIITILILIGILAVIAIQVFTKQFNKQPPIQSQSQPSIMPIASSTSAVQISGTNNIKTYRNTEWGFEFQYPQDLIIRENTFGSYYSKFNLQVEYWNKEGKYLSVFDVNVVLPEFADRTFLSIGATTSTIVVDGVPGIKYEYEFESLPEVAVVLPLDQYKVILGIGGSSKFYGHEGTFNQIISSFKFLK